MIRVTEVLDSTIPARLAAWFKRNSAAKCEKIGTETARIGSEVDKLIQQDIEDGGYITPLHDEGVANCLAGWEKVKKDYPDFVGSVVEMQTEISDGEIMGHPDYINQGKGFWGITDLKCTSGIRHKNWVQVAKYADIVMRSRKWKFPDFVRIIRLQRDCPIPFVVTVSDPNFIQYCIDVFEIYLRLYKFEFVMDEYFRIKNEDEALGITGSECQLLIQAMNQEEFNGTFKV